MIPIKDDRTIEEMLEECSALRFSGTPMLIHRTLNEFNAFVTRGIWGDSLIYGDEESKKIFSFVSAYGTIPNAKDEQERLREWAKLFVLWCRQEYKED